MIKYYLLIYCKRKTKLKRIYSEGPFGWAFEPAFAFVKAKSQPKDPKATSAFAQKQLFS